jgi:septal ring factor EnvC (AmiA/AmiB activator)
MMIRTVCVSMLGFVIVVPCCCQTSQADSQTFQAILTEIREIHEELRVTETTQILLAEMQMQQSQVNRAEQRVDEAQSKLSQLKTDRRYFEGKLARSEDALRQDTEPLKQKTAHRIDRKLKNCSRETKDGRARELCKGATGTRTTAKCREHTRPDSR